MINQHAFSKKADCNIISMKTSGNTTVKNKKREVIYCAIGEGMINVPEGNIRQRSNINACTSQGAVYRLSIKAIYETLMKMGRLFLIKVF